jgi:diguanylate cyclase (GGDEF)-like protein
MGNHPGVVEQASLEARIQSELITLESRKRDFWMVVVFAAAVLTLGALSLLVPTSFWRFNSLEVKIAPQVLFLVMMLIVLFVLYAIRRELEVHTLRLRNLQQTLSAQSDQTASRVDAVTNVFTRGFLHELLQGEISRAERNREPLTLLMCDLNNFKLINDRHGHLMGDYVLSQMAAIFKCCVRGSDHIVRYGGDEFLVVLPETDEMGAEIVRQRINEKVAAWDQTNRVCDYPLSVSTGLYVHAQGQSPEQDIAGADGRMYGEKQIGRQRAQGSPSAPTPR